MFTQKDLPQVHQTAQLGAYAFIRSVLSKFDNLLVIRSIAFTPATAPWGQTPENPNIAGPPSSDQFTRPRITEQGWVQLRELEHFGRKKKRISLRLFIDGQTFVAHLLIVRHSRLLANSLITIPYGVARPNNGLPYTS